MAGKMGKREASVKISVCPNEDNSGTCDFTLEEIFPCYFIDLKEMNLTQKKTEDRNDHFSLYIHCLAHMGPVNVYRSEMKCLLS